MGYPTPHQAVIPEEVVMQSSFTVGILVLQTEGLVSLSVTFEFLFKDAPRRFIRRTTRGCRGCRSSLLEYRFGRSGSSGFVGGFTVFGYPIADLGQEGVAVGIGVDIGISAVPNESGFLFEVLLKNRRRVRATYTPTSGLKIFAGYGFTKTNYCIICCF